MSTSDHRNPMFTRPEWLDGVVMFAGMVAWSVSQAIPVEFLWSSAADCRRLMYG